MKHGGWDFEQCHVVKLYRDYSPTGGRLAKELDWLSEQRFTIGKDYMAKPDVEEGRQIVWFAFLDKTIAAEFRVRFG